MGKIPNFFEQILQEASLHPETLPGQPIIEIAGENRVLIENHHGVAAYGKESLLINVPFGSVCICGCNLEILRMTKEQLLIHGRISSVVLRPGRKP